MTKIFKSKFCKTELDTLVRGIYANDWPIVYVIEGDKEVYIGETTNFNQRMKNHLSDLTRNNLKTVYLIANDKFNKSATLDIESLLIEYIAADGKYKLQNGNRGLKNHNYYERSFYRNEFENIWTMLQEFNLVKHKLHEIRNSDLFKMSPFKRLTDDQITIVESIEETIAIKSASKHIIHGDPGSGKTVLAVYLMKYLLSSDEFRNMKIGLVIPMTSLRKSIKKVFKGVKGLKSSMVMSPYDVVKRGAFDILIVDEAHRLTKRKNLSNYLAFDNVNKKLHLDKDSGTQLDWVEKSCKHMILFYDKNQTIKPTDIDGARFSSINAEEYSLKSQFRVKAGEDYISYIENILKLNEPSMKEFDGYDLRMFDNVNDMIQAIKTKDKEMGLCRNVSGYCWNWKSKKNKEENDIIIGDYQYKWNSVTGDWISSDNAINEIGCVHTTQGYDLNYCGVIIGKDLIFKNGKIRYNAEEYKDVSAKDLTLTSDEMQDYVINIYRILLTRGILGTYIYICDDNLRAYFEKYVKKHSI